MGRTLGRLSAKLPLEAGALVGGYVVERVIGIGGMAVVAVASHATEHHRVAIKMLLPENSSNKELRTRFEREERTLAQLHSEHVMRFYGGGEHEKQPYMLVEYLDGSDLGEHIKVKGPLDVEDAVTYVLQTCHALAEAHALGIVHRDLKPANLFLTRRTDGTPCIKVLDFGISKVSDAARGAEDSLVTRTRAVMGSPFYMSPEQMLSSKDVDARTDIWSLGVTLYELLTKTLPFAAEDTGAVCQRILQDKPTPLRKLRPTYPAELEAVITRCLERNPKNRFQTISNLAEKLAPLGPPHARFALAAIQALLRPTPSSPGQVGPSEDNPFEQTLLNQDELNAKNPQVEAGPPVPARERPGRMSATEDTTMYLKKGMGRGRLPLGAVALAAVGAFGLGTGFGWVLNLDTDPTHAGATVAATPPAAALAPTRTAPSPPAATADPTEAGEPPTVIDLQDLPPAGSEGDVPTPPPGAPGGATARPAPKPPTAAMTASTAPAASSAPKPKSSSAPVVKDFEF
ncbi:MAG: serine/threonine protein kinase [Polyangiaceae bacterium]|nr:serine/threonine protein kinase [Polyangiaceae bacterium]